MRARWCWMVLSAHWQRNANASCLAWRSLFGVRMRLRARRCLSGFLYSLRVSARGKENPCVKCRPVSLVLTVELANNIIQIKALSRSWPACVGSVFRACLENIEIFSLYLLFASRSKRRWRKRRLRSVDASAPAACADSALPGSLREDALKYYTISYFIFLLQISSDVHTVFISRKA